MEKCVSCGKTVIIPNKLKNHPFCQSCAFKIKMPFWKDKLYASDVELRQQKDEIINLAIGHGFPDMALDVIRTYFSEEEDRGFKCAIDGKCGQTLKVYQEYCVINTSNEQFDINERSKEYAKIIQSSETKVNFMDDPNKQNLLLNGLLSGRIVQTGICLLISPTFPDFQGLAALENPIYVSFSLVFALMSSLQGKAIRF